MVRILLGSPVSDHHAYCYEQFREGIKKLCDDAVAQQISVDILFVDNSKENEFFDRIRKDFPTVKISYIPDVKDRLDRLGVDAAGGTSQQFAAFIAAEVRKWGKVIAEAGIPRE